MRSTTIRSKTKEQSDAGIQCGILLACHGKSNIYIGKPAKLVTRSCFGYASHFCSFANAQPAKVRLASLAQDDGLKDCFAFLFVLFVLLENSFPRLWNFWGRVPVSRESNCSVCVQTNKFSFGCFEQRRAFLYKIPKRQMKKSRV